MTSGLSSWSTQLTQPLHRRWVTFVKSPKVRRQLRRYKKLAGTVPFGRFYVGLALASLLSTTLFWSILGARLQSQNADQLVDPYLFQNKATFQGADFPSAHTFLLKWPIFYLLKLMGYSAQSYQIVTVTLVLVTVATLAYLLYRIDRRPLIFGTLCLALASCLLLTPAQPYAGGLLPVNLAMVATRNIEYIFYLGCLVALSRQPSLRNWRFGLAAIGLTILLASDRLFLTLTIASSLLLLLGYAVAARWKIVSLSVGWLLASVAAVAGSAILLHIINLSHLTHIVSEGSASPYSFVQTPKDFVLAAAYAVMSLLTNFGANPAHAAIKISDILGQFVGGLLGYGGLGYLLNVLVAVAALVSAGRILAATLTKRGLKALEHDLPGRLSLMLIANTLVAVGLFTISNHYYAVDSRYVAIALFSGFIVLASVGRRLKRLPIMGLSLMGLILLLSLGVSVPQVLNTYHSQQTALKPLASRNATVDQALRQHNVKTLVGDYWRVLPIKTISQRPPAVTPLGSCTAARQTLTSQTWQPDLRRTSFAYLLTLDGSLTDYPNCSLAQISNQYGQPNSSLLIAGSYDHPKEQLLFYDHGQRPTTAIKAASASPSLEPATLDTLPSPTCFRPTIVNIVAHEDDDLLFMNPDLQHSITQTDCVRTIYLTAGDSGRNRFYWTQRQQGAESAYAEMLGVPNAWTQQIIKLGDGQYVTVASPVNVKRISLLFLNLPDGDIHGDGFSGSDYESLAKLENGQIDSMQSVDGQSTFTINQLTDDLSTLLQFYQPSEIRTQADTISDQYPDHSDHISTKHLAQAARQQYLHQQFDDSVSIPVRYYIGYPIHAMDPNLNAEDQARKTAAFLAYAKYDGGVCDSENSCRQTPTYGSYLNRQYLQNP